MKPASLRFTLALGVALTPVFQAAADPPENPAACVEGPTEPLTLVYGQNTTGCVISPAADIDTFRFQAATGDHVRVNVHGASGTFDPMLEIRDPAGMIIPPACGQSDHCDGGCCGTCSLTREFVAAGPGFYTLIVSDWGANEPGNYDLDLEGFPAPNALKMLFNSSIVGVISPASDCDVFRFEGVAGTTIRIVVAGSSGTFDPRITLWNTAFPECEMPESLCDGGCCGTCSTLLDQTLSVSGVYNIIVDDWGANETGNYSITLQCLFGPCQCLERDINGDNVVNVDDLLIIIAQWGPCPKPCTSPCLADVTGDCAVGVDDLLAIISSWGPCPQ